MSKYQRLRSDALAHDVLQNIHDREALIERLENLHAKEAHGRSGRIHRLLYGIHNASLAVVEAIAAWNIGKQDEWYHKKNIEIHSSSLSEEPRAGDDADGQTLRSGLPSPFNSFSWKGQQYLQKMFSDLDFVGDITEAISFLGAGAPFHRNPFLLPLGIDQLVGEQILLSPRMRTNAWKDVNVQRIRRAAFVLLLDEYHRKGGPSQLSMPADERMDGNNCRLRRDALHSAKFHPPGLESKDIDEYADDAIVPPATVAVAVCCAHLILGSVGTDVTDKLVYLTKTIVLKICRQPSNELIRKARIYNPLRPPDGTENVIKLVYPFIVHKKMSPNLMVGIPRQIIYLTVWLRTLVTQLVKEDMSSDTSNAVDRIFRELEANFQREHPKADALSRELHPKDGKEKMHDDANKENEYTCKNASVQTEEISPSRPKSESSERALKAILGDVSESKRLVPLPVPITVNLTEGSQSVLVNGDVNEARVLEQGDVVRIYDARESSNWTISHSPNAEDNGLITFRLSAAYDHSRIVAHERELKDDILNRLCYPYKKETDGYHKPVSAPTTNVERTRHVASDENGSIHSPLYIKEARIWKLIPEEEDTRTVWRKEYDNGAIPWSNDNAGCHKFVAHFRVRVSLDWIEQSCIDSPYPLSQCVHQQRVNFFECVPLLDVIDEAFHVVCRWHPKGNLIDNVKWAKLSRKMKFLSNVKNSKHEIDMAFVRRNQDRKLDLTRFRAIFEDIASIQYPPLSKEDALSKVVAASIVMIPDVNAMMWKEAKLMAIKVEAKRVCAQIRISARLRRNLQRAEYLKEKAATIVIAKHARQFLAHIFVSKLLKAMRENEEYQRRSRSAIVVQTAWRQFFWRNRFLLHQERRIEEKRKHIAATRSKFRAMRERERALIVFRDVICIDSTIAAVTISFHDESYLQDENSMLLKVYVPTTKETFSFTLEESAIRECLEKVLCSEGRLSWDEMLKENVLKELTKRLMLRIVRGRPIFLFSRRNMVEKGILVDKRVVRAVGQLFILSTFRSPHDFVFSTYQPSTRLQMRTMLSMKELREWLHETQQTTQPAEDNLRLLDLKNQSDLTEWLVKRVVIRKNPEGESMQLLLQFQAEEERVIKLITKVQAQWRRLKSLRGAKEKTIGRYEKIFVRENNVFAYRDVLTDARQWEKPKLLGEGDLGDPVDEWRREETLDPTTGQKHEYYANYATGQSSWLSEEGAARLVQRRYRSKHESDLLGQKIQLPDIVKAMKFIHGTRVNYDLEPNKLSNMVNFALLVHCLDHNFSEAKPVYEKALEQSPNHPLICRAYGIFLLASRQTPLATTFQTACRLLHEANVVDPTQAKFQSASEIYFRWAVLVDAKNPLALLNYALLHQCIYKKYDHAEKIYRAALALDPTNTFVVENYRLFCDERYPGGAYASLGPPFSAVRRSRVLEERQEWAEWSKMIDPDCPKAGMEEYFYNRFSKQTMWRVPNIQEIYETRMKRSKCVRGKTSNWVEYFDTRTQTSFFYDVYTKQYTCANK